MSDVKVQLVVRDRPFNLKGGLWFVVSFIIFFSDNTRIRILIFFIAQSANFNLKGGGGVCFFSKKIF
jgi:hypothetical protein